MRSIVPGILLFFAILVAVYFHSPKVYAGCLCNSGSSICFPSYPSWGKCLIDGTTVYDCSCGGPGQTDCPGMKCWCDTAQSAQAVCGSGGGIPGPSCPGASPVSCDNSTCSTTGGCNCNDYDTQASCLGQAPYTWNSTCQWSNGICTGKYCCVEHPDVGNGKGQGCGYYNDVRDTCVGSGCHWTPAPNSCAPGSRCSQTTYTCTTECGDTAACTAPVYGPKYPAGIINELNPTFTWDVYNIPPCYYLSPSDPNYCYHYTNLNIYAGNNCTGASLFYNAPGFSDTSKAWSVISPSRYLQSNTAYSWNLYEDSSQQSTSACLNFTTSASCTMNLSSNTTTLHNGGTGYATAVVYPSGNSGVNSVAWNLNPSGVISAVTPTTPASTNTPAQFTPNNVSSLLNGLVAYWKLDDGTVGNTTVPALDSISNKYANPTGTTVIGPASSPASKIGNARTIGGGRIQPPASSSYPSGDRTIAAWVYPTSNSGLGNPVFAGGACPGGLNASDMFGVAGSTAGCAGVVSGQSKIYYDHWGNACNLSTGTIPLNQWSFIAVTYTSSSNTLTFYTNNNTPNSVTPAGNPLANFTNAAGLVIGGNDYSSPCGSTGGSTTAGSFSGNIDEVGLWNRALTAGEIGNLYNSGAGNTYQPAATTFNTATTLTAITTGTGIQLTAVANLDTGNTCTSNTLTFSVIPAFFQTFGGDITAKGNVIDSYLPSGLYISGNY